MQQLTDNVYAVPGMSIGRIYIITGKEGLALVDTSLATNTATRLESHLQSLGFQLSDIRDILITHAHPDHIGGLAEFQNLTNARIGVHRRDAPVVRGESPLVRPQRGDLKGLAWAMSFMPSFSPPTPARVDVEFNGGDALDDILPGLTVVELHGHSPGQVGFWWPEKRLLFGGDVMLRLPWGLSLPIPAFTVNMKEAKQSIRKAAEMDIDILCLGHGAPIVGGAAAQVRAFADGLKL